MMSARSRIVMGFELIFFAAIMFLVLKVLLGIGLMVLGVALIFSGKKTLSVVLRGDHPERRKGEIFIGNALICDRNEPGFRFGRIAYTADGYSLMSFRPYFRTVESIEEQARQENENIMKTLRDLGGRGWVV